MTTTAGLKPNEVEELKEIEAMGFELNDASFGFTAYVDEQAHEKVNTTLFDGLNEQLKIDIYGLGITKIVFAFIALAPQYLPKKQSIEYFPEDKLVNIGLRLNYEQLLSVDTQEALKMMKVLYLKGIKALALFEIEDFNLEEFHTDLEAYFFPSLTKSNLADQ